MTERNLSSKNAFVRFTCGTAMTAFGIARLSRDSTCMKGKAMVILGSMKMAEGIFHYCPTKAMMSSNMESAVSGMFSSGNPDIAKMMQDFSKIVGEGSSNSNSGNSSNNGNSSSNNSSGNSNSNSNNSTNKGNSNASSSGNSNSSSNNSSSGGNSNSTN